MEDVCEDIDQMFSTLLGEMDLLTQSLEVEALPPPSRKPSKDEFNFAVGFKDLNESLNALEDTDLDALMADLVADISEVEKSALQGKKEAPCSQPTAMAMPSLNASDGNQPGLQDKSFIQVGNNLPPPTTELALDFPPAPLPSTIDPAPIPQEEKEAQAKADKIKLALEKMKEAKVKKLVVKVHMNDNSTKSLMVDERQLARDILDNLFEKTHCDCNLDWCLYEIYPELQIERFFEDHENVIGVLSDWTRDTENKILFLEKAEKYAVFKNPQNFYLANKEQNENKEMNEKCKEALLEESFCRTSVIVPDIEGALYLKEDGKKSWKRRYFLLRASGIYYVPKGKTKTSRDLSCFIQFENVNVYYGIQYKVKYKAPTDYCFVLKIRWRELQNELTKRWLHFDSFTSRLDTEEEEHPQIQKESHYIKYLCCDNQQALHQWVTGIRIAKYGKTLYNNYIRALQRAGLASRLAKPGNAESIAAVDSSSKGNAHANGQVPQSATPSITVSSENEKHAETSKVKKPASTTVSNQALPPITPQFKKRKPSGLHPPPPPQRRSSAITTSLCLPSDNEKSIYSSDPEFPPPPDLILPPPELDDLPPPPPPPPEYCEAPPNFIPPPPPFSVAGISDSELLPPPPPPPPPPPSVSAPSMPPPIRKKPLPPPRRQEESDGKAGGSRQGAPLPGGNAAGQGDFMSDLMRALQKKRGET